MSLHFPIIPVLCTWHTGYPEHSEHFYIPDADCSVKLWANALNEVILLLNDI